MRRRIKLWSVAKWLGAGAAAIVFVVWVASCWMRVRVDLGDGPWSKYLSSEIHSGGASIAQYSGRSVLNSSPMFVDGPLTFSMEDKPFRVSLLPRFGRGFADFYVFVPLWIPLVSLLVMTAAARRYEALARRRAASGACEKCGYDRRGIGVKAACPECGAVPLG